MALPRDPEPQTVLVCNHCTRMHERHDSFNANAYGAHPLPNEEHEGYCDKHGKHDDFSTMEV